MRIKKIFSDLRNIIRGIFNKEDVIESGSVIIRTGPNKKTWGCNGYVIELRLNKDKYIVLLESSQKGISYEMHIKNKSDSQITQEEKDILFDALYNFLEDNDVLTSFGGCTPGGLTAIENLIKKYGFEKIDSYHGEYLYWATGLIDNKKFDNWINKPEHRNMFEIIDNSKPLSISNTLPIIPVIKK